ncbi:hypothetical protein EDB84DRAFT_1435011 [Lactarius hengduanensis]|nr:hypothetical protein EDB84DRAFT_1435011 [Lactarius hengduanensis]
MWSWSVVGGVCNSGLPAAAAAIVIVMLGVAGSLEELKWVEYLCYSQQQRPRKGNAALNWVCVGTLSCVIIVANAAPEGGLGARVPAVVATPAVIVKAIVLGLRKCTTDLCERHATREAGENTSYMKKSRMSVCSAMREETPPKKSKWGGQFEATATELVQWWPLRWPWPWRSRWLLGKAVVRKYEAPKLHHACDEAIWVEVGAVWELEALGSGYRRDGLEHLNVELIWVNRGKW